jgi:hypothetical protein
MPLPLKAVQALILLISLQISIGILYKVSQIDGKYPYSPAGALCISEAIKLILSILAEVKLWKADGAHSWREVPGKKSVRVDERITE